MIKLHTQGLIVEKFFKKKSPCLHRGIFLILYNTTTLSLFCYRTEINLKLDCYLFLWYYKDNKTEGGKNMPKYIVVYKLGERFAGQLSAKEGINLHSLHAKTHGGKVLFTINKAPAPEFRDKIEKIILTTRDGSFAVRADVDYLGKGTLIAPPADYTVPSIWDNEDRSNMGWFCLSNLEIIEIKPGDYTSVNGKDLLTSISANSYMTYVQI